MRGLTVDRVSVRFGSVLAVNRVSLELDAGDVLAVLGPSGCGKSTLLRAVAGLEHLESGAVRYDGADLDRVPTHRRGFALMFQDGQLFPHRSVYGNVAYPLRLRRRPRAEVRERVAELLDLVGLPEYGDRAPATLSGGERQRVALARSLAVRPRLLLLDEPLSALDRGLRDRLALDLRAVLRAQGTTALLVTHDQEEAFAVADRMAVMRDGRLVQQGSLEGVWRAPADPETARFLGYATVLTGAPAAAVLAGMPADAVEAAMPAGPLPGPGHQARGVAVALRRSALRVHADGPLEGTVTEARLTPELLRLTADVQGVGLLNAVAGRDDPVRPGSRVRLRVDPTRVALLRQPEGL